MLDLKTAVFTSVGIAGGVIITIVFPPFWAVVICGGVIFVVIRFLTDNPCCRRRR